MSKQTDLINVTDAITVSGSNVGIGTSSPSGTLEVAGDGVLRVRPSTDNSQGVLYFNDTTTPGSSYRADIGIVNDGGLSFKTTGSINTAPSERMRIDSSGNLLVGTTDTTLYNNSDGSEGVRIAEDHVSIASDARTVFYVNRQTSDGEIINIRKDGSTVGSIGVINSSLICSFEASGSGGSGIGVHKSVPNIYPVRNGVTVDNTLDLGSGSRRWDDIYATNGTIQTSDRNEKQDIEVLSDAETRVAQACKGLLRKFRWQDAVAEKGDDARIHFGIIAQDLQDAFAAEGLDAGRYAMFISSTWWEAQTEVPAVEAVAEVLDDDGNVVTEAVEAKEAYTRTDTYETQAEAPEGATERTRLGVRYPELLAFIIGAM